jgi:archaellum component FlaC
MPRKFAFVPLLALLALVGVQCGDDSAERLRSERSRTADLSEKLDKAKSALRTVEKQLATADNENEKLTGQVTDLKKQVKDLKAKLPTTTAAEPAATTKVPTTKAPSKPKPSGSATLTCRHYRNVIDDFTQGILTTPELREKIKEVNETAARAEEDDIAQAGNDLLVAVTADDADAFLTAVDAMDAACERVGM